MEYRLWDQVCVDCGRKFSLWVYRSKGGSVLPNHLEVTYSSNLPSYYDYGWSGT